VEKEGLIDAITAISGSGPAYGYLFLEAMGDAGVRCGLSRKDAYDLAAQTLIGAAKMVQQTAQHPGELKDQVTSPAGTTIEAIAALEKNGFRNAVHEAVQAAFLKAKNMK
jgi:pyrroline-5-carboxylate reductase